MQQKNSLLLLTFMFLFAYGMEVDQSPIIQKVIISDARNSAKKIDEETLLRDYENYFYISDNREIWLPKKYVHDLYNKNIRCNVVTGEIYVTSFILTTNEHSSVLTCHTEKKGLDTNRQPNKNEYTNSKGIKKYECYVYVTENYVKAMNEKLMRKSFVTHVIKK